MSLLIYLFLLLTPFLVLPEIHYTCTSYFGYFIPWFSKDCYYHPDVDDHIIDIIQRHIGVCEIHQVKTEDNYHLTLFRIPRKNPKGVILFQHTISYDSKLWINQFNESVAFIFWRAGYDIWLGNYRGSEFSKKNDFLEPNERLFWDFSFHELGYYDNQAVVEYIRKKTQEEKIIYVGYSLGGIAGLVYATTRPKEAANNIKLIVLIAPVIYSSHATSVAKYLVPTFLYLHKKVSTVVDVGGSIMNEHSLIFKSFKTFWNLFPCKYCLQYFVAPLCGWSDYGLDPKYISSVINTLGYEGSVKIFEHAYQVHVSGRFAMFDYGQDDNVKLYGTKHPPIYPLHKIKIPVVTVYGEKDNLVPPKDIERLTRALPEESQVYGNIKADGQSHIDFCCAQNRLKIFNKILDLINKVK